MEITQEQREAWQSATRNSPFNQWLRARTTSADGSLDLALLRKVAAEYGVDAERYAHLNPGQQRMNVGNRLRPLVPAHVLEADVALNVKGEGEESSSSIAYASHATEPEWPFIQEATIAELLRIQAAAIEELKSRGIVRTGNAPLGDYAEHLFSTALGWTLSPNSASGYDATCGEGIRYQVKARRLLRNAAGERQLSVMRNLPSQSFDFLAAVLFARDFSVQRAAIIPHSVVQSRAMHIPHVNGWRFILEDAVWQLEGVRDVTQILHEAARALS